MYPERPRNDRRQVLDWWLHPQESGPEVVRGPNGESTSPTWFGPVLMSTQQSYLSLLKLLKTVRYLSPLRVAAPATLPREKVSMTMNEEFYIKAFSQIRIIYSGKIKANS